MIVLNTEPSSFFPLLIFPLEGGGVKWQIYPWATRRSVGGGNDMSPPPRWFDLFWYLLYGMNFEGKMRNLSCQFCKQFDRGEGGGCKIHPGGKKIPPTGKSHATTITPVHDVICGAHTYYEPGEVKTFRVICILRYFYIRKSSELSASERFKI